MPSVLRIVPIVEGHGEVDSAPLLLRRLGEYLEARIEVLRPIRGPRSQLGTAAGLKRAVELAALKLGPVRSGATHLILVLFDADDDAACRLGPQALGWAQNARRDINVACVLANKEFETWFVASAETLQELLDLGDPPVVPQDPEKERLGKGWIDRRFRGTRYGPTIDQPRMVARMDFDLCRRRSGSFDKLCREIEKLARRE